MCSMVLPPCWGFGVGRSSGTGPRMALCPFALPPDRENPKGKGQLSGEVPCLLFSAVPLEVF